MKVDGLADVVVDLLGDLFVLFDVSFLKPLLVLHEHLDVGPFVALQLQQLLGGAVHLLIDVAVHLLGLFELLVKELLVRYAVNCLKDWELCRLVALLFVVVGLLASFLEQRHVV